MVTKFAFSEERIRKLAPPSGKDREVSQGQRLSRSPSVRHDHRKQNLLSRQADRRAADTAQAGHGRGAIGEAGPRGSAAISGKIAAGQNPQADRRQKREEPTLERLHQYWMLYANAHKGARTRRGGQAEL